MKRLSVQNRRLPDHRRLECRDAEEFQTLPDHLEERPTDRPFSLPPRGCAAPAAALDLT